MPTIKAKVTQSGINAATFLAIPTGIVLDGKTGFEINAVSAFFDFVVQPITTFQATMSLATETGAQDKTDPDNICETRLSQIMLTSGAAPITYDRMCDPLFFPRLTVQPNLYLGIQSVALAGLCVVTAIISYELVKLTDLQVMQLLQGGA